MPAIGLPDWISSTISSKVGAFPSDSSGALVLASVMVREGIC